MNGLAQLALKLTAPGVPDVYQGCEAWDLNLVDPDNRRPVDYAWRERTLAELAARSDDPALPRELLAQWQDGRVKLWLTARLLALRTREEALFAQGRYVPVRVRGAHRDAVCAYLRSDGTTHVLCVVPRLWQHLAGGGHALARGGDVGRYRRRAACRASRGAMHWRTKAPHPWALPVGLGNTTGALPLGQPAA